MKLTLRYTSLTLVVAAVAFIMGIGCSNQSSTAPASAGITEGDALAVVAEGANPPSFVETFDGRSNVGSWTFFGIPNKHFEKIDQKGGNPGAFWHSSCSDRFGCLHTYGPMLSTEVGVSSVFTGNYRERGVRQVGVDLAVFGPPGVVTEQRPVTLILTNDMGTPFDYTDDIKIYSRGGAMPAPEAGFREYTYSIPSHKTEMPDGWGALGGYGTGDDDADWNTVMTNVTRIGFRCADVDYGYMFQNWDVGADNPRIWFEN